MPADIRLVADVQHALIKIDILGNCGLDALEDTVARLARRGLRVTGVDFSQRRESSSRDSAETMKAEICAICYTHNKNQPMHHLVTLD